MSAFDPKRTYVPKPGDRKATKRDRHHFLSRARALFVGGEKIGGTNEAARFHQVARRNGCRVAVCCVGAANYADAATFGRSSNGGLIVTPSAFSAIFRERIIALAARHKLPAIYFSRFFVTDGGLISYAPNTTDRYSRAAGYIDRILKGEKPADMPVQAPTKFELVINLRTAQGIDLTIPGGVLAVADQVIK